MPSLLLPFHFVLLMFAGWVNRHQLDVIEYLQEENRVLKARLGGKHLRFTDAERCRLARKAHALGRKPLSELDTLAHRTRYSAIGIPCPMPHQKLCRACIPV